MLRRCVCICSTSRQRQTSAVGNRTRILITSALCRNWSCLQPVRLRRWITLHADRGRSRLSMAPRKVIFKQGPRPFSCMFSLYFLLLLFASLRSRLCLQQLCGGKTADRRLPRTCLVLEECKPAVLRCTRRRCERNDLIRRWGLRRFRVFVPTIDGIRVTGDKGRKIEKTRKRRSNEGNKLQDPTEMP